MNKTLLLGLCIVLLVIPVVYGEFNVTYNIGDTPYAVAVDGNGNIWTANYADDDVSFLNASDSYSRTDYAVGNAPRGIAVDSNNNIWVANLVDNDVSMLDASNSYSKTDYAVGTHPYGVAVDSNDNIWVANPDDDDVSMLDASNSYSRTDYAVGNAPHGVAVDSNDNIWVTNYDDGDVSFLDASNSYSRTDYAVGNNPIAIAVDGNDNIWVTNLVDNDVSMLNASNSYSRTDYAVGNTPYGVAVDSNNNIWVADYSDDDVSMLNASDSYSKTEYAVGDGAIAIVVDSSNNDDIWVANNLDDTVSYKQGVIAFLVFAIDNYTKYGYSQTGISNFTINMTNGTDTLINTSSGLTINMGSLIGLWNITITHPDYSNVTYENHNVSEDLTAYMYQTHEHYDNTTEYISEDTYIDMGNSVNYVSSTNLMADQYASPRKWFMFFNFSQNNNVSGLDYLQFRAYSWDGYGGNNFYHYMGKNCNNYNLSTYTGTNAPSCDWTSYGMIGYTPIHTGWETFNLDLDGAGNRIFQYSRGGANADHSFYYSTEHGTYPRTVYLNYTSNFTIEVVDEYDGSEVYNTTINISNGDWSREDVLTGVNTITYPFDEGIYNITITSQAGFTTETHSNYDLSTESNYLLSEIESSGYAILNLTIYDEETELIINTTNFGLNNITIDAIGVTHSKETTITDGNWFDESKEFMPEIYWFSAQGTDGQAGDWDIRSYFANLIPAGEGINIIDMYLLNNTDTSQICIMVYDGEGMVMEDAYVKLWRHYSANNTYKLVQIGKTDAQGQVNLIAVPDSVVYKYTIQTDLGGEILYTSTPSYLSDDSCYTHYISEAELVGVEWFDSGEVNYAWYYSNSTSTINFLWDDPNSLVITACLKTIKSGMFSTEIGYDCQDSASGQLYHEIDNTTEATYISYGYVYMSSDPEYEIYVGSFSHEVNLNTAETIGKLGLFLVVLVIIVMAFAGIWSGGVSVIMAGVTILLAQATGLIMMNIVWTIGILIVGGIIMFLNRD